MYVYIPLRIYRRPICGRPDVGTIRSCGGNFRSTYTPEGLGPFTDRQFTAYANTIWRQLINSPFTKGSNSISGQFTDKGFTIYTDFHSQVK